MALLKSKVAGVVFRSGQSYFKGSGAFFTRNGKDFKTSAILSSLIRMEGDRKYVFVETENTYYFGVEEAQDEKKKIKCLEQMSFYEFPKEGERCKMKIVLDGETYTINTSKIEKLNVDTFGAVTSVETKNSVYSTYRGVPLRQSETA